MPALCRSAAAYDSLPRGARGPNAAVHRLRVSSGAAFRDSEEFGSPSGSTAALVAAAKDNAPSGRRRRTHSAAPGGAAAALLSPRSRRARKDVQLPLASSGPSDGWDSSASDERDAEAQLLRGVSSAPSSPVKGAAPHSRSIGAPLSPRSQERGAARGIGSPGSPVPARKRIVDKRVIGLPTNFQHTGHIGAASYGTAVSQASAAALQAQLSEVAAALSMDLGPMSTPASRVTTASLPAAPPAPPTKETSLETAATPLAAVDETLAEPTTPFTPTVEHYSAPTTPFTPTVEQPVSPALLSPAEIDEQDAGDTTLTAPDVASPTRSSASSAHARTPSDETPSIRAVVRRSSEDEELADDFAPAFQSSYTPAASFPQTSAPSSPRMVVSPASPVRRKVPSTMGPSSSVTPSAFGSPSRSSAAPPAVPSTGGFGRAKRKPVPAALAGILADPAELASAGHSTDDDVPLSPEADLSRNASVLGDLPSRFGAAGGAAAKNGSWAARGSTREKLNPLERARIAAAKLEEAQRLLVEGTGEPAADAEAPAPPGKDEPIRAPTLAQQAASIRLNGKRMVQGPTGAYITDTANGRWNTALDEITRALAAAGMDPNEPAQDDEESMREAMRQADAVLGRLGHDV
ncbi:hypothetical protein FA09DRAFT_336534 [Tilletiopsis washingtonensis]|uniref:CRIB domain-containing protein n=1 Tax=Tilletiopsis washingtonensis TaxID=58919 RepID=A0A316ZF59_9BASI|nr:hypothetical protein FA09DRAFT_336534 [Tilletiopsis washingtonensis]PWO00398.1 hypothetical protein FA09DRAFT_336534 [Tilletiopsis washingtonensis]